MVSYVFFLAKRMVFLEIGIKEEECAGDEALRRMGFAPLPFESPTSYRRRAHWILEQSAIRDERESWAGSDELLLARKLVKDLFEVDPAWVPVFYSDQQLPFWMGACTWLITDPATGWTRPVIQLRKGLQESERLWGLYDKTEILAHELIHACRCALPDSPFEEHFAYLSSPSRFRRYWGPLFNGTWEQWFFCLGLGVGCVGSWWSPWANLIPLAGLLAQGLRLVSRQRQFKRLLEAAPKSQLLHLT